jgi:RNA polymerase sigma-32 factor
MEPETETVELTDLDPSIEEMELSEVADEPRKFGGFLKGTIRMLTREEELALALAYRESRDPAIARQLVESHLPLVVKIARGCNSRSTMLPDLIQEGCLGLMRAVEKYDPDKGIRLSSYAAWWIRAYVYQYIMTNSRLLKVATTFTQRKLFFNLKRERAQVESEGKEATPKELATRLGCSEELVVEMTQRLDGREVSFDLTLAVSEPGSADAQSGVCSMQRPDEAVESSDLHAAIRTKLQDFVPTLHARERAILEERLMADKPITLRDLGQKFGISRERARQLEGRLKNRLKPMLQGMLGEDHGTDKWSSGTAVVTN